MPNPKPVLFVLFAATSIAQSPLATDMLAAHNAARATLKLAPLTWSAKLADHAQKWANTLIQKNQFTHDLNSPYGENLFAIQGAPATPARVLESWMSEAQDYDYKSNTCRKVCGHYTQILWATTKQVGCAVARDARREVWVCNYDPPGNWEGQRPY